MKISQNKKNDLCDIETRSKAVTCYNKRIPLKCYYGKNDHIRTFKVITEAVTIVIEKHS